MDMGHIALAALAGAGCGLAWGYRTALSVALGGARARPDEPQPTRKALAVLSPQQQRDYAENIR